jgi:hypothetical protein
MMGGVAHEGGASGMLVLGWMCVEFRPRQGSGRGSGREWATSLGWLGEELVHMAPVLSL